MRCPTCAAPTTSPVKAPHTARIVIGVMAILVVLVVVVRLSTGGASPRPRAQADQIQPASAFQAVTRPDLGFAVDVPSAWLPAPDNSPTTLSYAASRPSDGSLRVSFGRDASPLADHVNGLIDALRQQGGLEFAQTNMHISGFDAIRLDYRFPTSGTPGSPLAAHSSFLVKRDSTVFSFQLATTDPVAMKATFDHITSSMRLL